MKKEEYKKLLKIKLPEIIDAQKKVIEAQEKLDAIIQELVNKADINSVFYESDL